MGCGSSRPKADVGPQEVPVLQAPCEEQPSSDNVKATSKGSYVEVEAGPAQPVEDGQAWAGAWGLLNQTELQAVQQTLLKVSITRQCGTAAWPAALTWLRRSRAPDASGCEVRHAF